MTLGQVHLVRNPAGQASRPYVGQMTGAISGLAGVLIWTSAQRFEGLRAFYVEVLGLRPRSDRPGFVNFELGPSRLTLGIHNQVDQVSRDPLRIMINLAVDDIEPLHNRLVAAGVPCLREPSPEPWGGLVATYSDPDHNTVQLMTGTR